MGDRALPTIGDQVVDFYYRLFECVFATPFQQLVAERLKRDHIARAIQEAAGAASQAVTRFFDNENLSSEDAVNILAGMENLATFVDAGCLENPNLTPEPFVEEVIPKLPANVIPRQERQASIFRITLHLTVQALMLVGPIMGEWRKLGFPREFQLLSRVVARLNRISEQLDVVSTAGTEAADERYELTYRDYLLQRFHRVEAGTVKMATNLDVDLRELFVVPHLRPRPRDKQDGSAAALELLSLSAARKVLAQSRPQGDENTNDLLSIEQILEFLSDRKRLVLVGAPGSGKSTFLEWLQLQLADIQLVFALAGKQAIPLLLRVRQLDPHDLPRAAALIEKATASADRARLMPHKWIERMLKAGRVLFMLDGLDEVEPDLRDKRVLPWLRDLCVAYPMCIFIVSSRPVGYAVGALDKLKFTEADVLDFAPEQVLAYAQHWCTAVRLAQNELEQEARLEGMNDGEIIVGSFKDNRYITDLARNPLMLSAICLVNYFEGGRLPEDRAMLYKLCVEGLLHNWDQRRGILSPFLLDEKLSVCRELALAMQADDHAEYAADKVLSITQNVLGDADRARALLEHIRYRSGLVLERRPFVFAFAHLTFQEYLAAVAIHEGNELDIDGQWLAASPQDPRWREVIVLYCGVATAVASRQVIEALLDEADLTKSSSSLLADCFFSCGRTISGSAELRQRVLEKIAQLPLESFSESESALRRFPIAEAKSVANRLIGSAAEFTGVRMPFSEACAFLRTNPDLVIWDDIYAKIKLWRQMNTYSCCQILYLFHSLKGTSLNFLSAAERRQIYSLTAPELLSLRDYYYPAEMALMGLGQYARNYQLESIDDLQVLDIFSSLDRGGVAFYVAMGFFEAYQPSDASAIPELLRQADRIIGLLKDSEVFFNKEAISAIQRFTKRIEEGEPRRLPKWLSFWGRA